MIHLDLQELPDHILEQLLKALDHEIEELRRDRMNVVAEQNRRRYGDNRLFDC